MISMLKKVDEPHKCASWARDPKCHSDNAKNLMSLAHEKLGWQEFQEGVRSKDKTASSAKIQLAIQHYEKYKELAKSVGNMTHVNDAETKIARSKHLDPLNKDNTKQNLPRLRATYEQDPSPLNSSNLAMALRLEGHQIEIERHMARELVKNRRLLGPTNPLTLELKYGIKGLAVRRVKMLDEATPIPMMTFLAIVLFATRAKVPDASLLQWLLPMTSKEETNMRKEKSSPLLWTNLLTSSIFVRGHQSCALA